MALDVVAAFPSPKSQEVFTIADPPLVTEVLVKEIGTPAQALSGLAVKFAVGDCADTETRSREPKRKNINFT